MFDCLGKSDFMAKPEKCDSMETQGEYTCEEPSRLPSCKDRKVFQANLSTSVCDNPFDGAVLTNHC